MIKEHLKIAVVGATGNVGRITLKVLEEQGFAAKNIVAVASDRSVNQEIDFAGEKIIVESLSSFDFSKVQFAIFVAGGDVSAQYAEKAAESGCIIIDNSSYFRMREGVPLVIPEINAHAISDISKQKIIANPNCSTIQLLMALKPLNDLAPITRVVVSTYQSVSGAGKNAMDELCQQTQNFAKGKDLIVNHLSRQIAFNVIPQIDKFLDDGFTKEEWKMAVETVKIMEAPIKLTATCVRVPVMVGHAVSVNVEFASDISLPQAVKALRSFPGVVLVDDILNQDPVRRFATSIDSAGKDPVMVSRLRRDETVDNGLAFWVVADNLRKGAALNAVQIMEDIINRLF